MKGDRTRLVRRALVALVLVVGVAIVWSLRRPRDRPGASRPAPSASAAPKATTVEDLVFVRFRAGEREVLLKAHAMVGQEGSAQRFQGVEVSLPFVSQEGEKRTLTISAEDCLYQAQPQRATFKGHVKARTDDGFELETEMLRYRSEPVLEIRTDGPAAFKRGKASGTANMLHYRAGSGVQLSGDVKLHLEEEAGPPTEIQATTASASREQGIVWFEGGVSVQQGANELRARRLKLNMTPDFTVIERAAAIEEADLRVGAVPGVTQGGEKRLRGRRINMAFRSKGVLEAVSAVNPASLEILPGAGGPQERRRITSSALQLLFDEQGRLTALNAQSAGPSSPPEQRKTVLVMEPTSPPGPARRVESGSLFATLDPETGGVKAARFEQEVVFKEPGRAAWASLASFDEASGLITLTGGEPRIVDEGQGSDLRGREIRLGTRSQMVSARQSVRQTIKRKGLRGPLPGDEPAEIFCRQFDYDPASHTAHYREDALLRSGEDEIRASQMELQEPAEGQRRFLATGSVRSVFHPRADKAVQKPEKAAQKPPAPIEVRSQDMLYEEKTLRIVYTGDVEIRQGDILTKSPKAEALLTADGSTIDRVLAGSPVELRQGQKRAHGEHGTYTPRDQTLVLVGEDVELSDGDRRLKGRILTFQSGSDRIRVDGREEVRSEAVFRRREPQKP